MAKQHGNEKLDSKRGNVCFRAKEEVQKRKVRTQNKISVQEAVSDKVTAPFCVSTKFDYIFSVLQSRWQTYIAKYP